MLLVFRIPLNLRSKLDQHHYEMVKMWFPEHNCETFSIQCHIYFDGTNIVHTSPKNDAYYRLACLWIFKKSAFPAGDQLVRLVS